MRDTISAIVATAIGAFIGTIFSLQFTFIWWLGMLSGGLVGYLLYDYKMVGAAIKGAYCDMVAWRPNRRRWILRGVYFKEFFKMLGVAIVAIGSIIAPFGFILVVYFSDATGSMDKILLTAQWVISSIIYCVCGVFLVLHFDEERIACRIRHVRNFASRTMNFSKQLYTKWIPIGILTIIKKPPV